jgi:hypothetical protein
MTTNLLHAVKWQTERTAEGAAMKAAILAG